MLTRQSQPQQRKDAKHFYKQCETRIELANLFRYKRCAEKEVLPTSPASRRSSPGSRTHPTAPEDAEESDKDNVFAKFKIQDITSFMDLKSERKESERERKSLVSMSSGERGGEV